MDTTETINLKHARVVFLSRPKIYHEVATRLFNLLFCFINKIDHLHIHTYIIFIFVH